MNTHEIASRIAAKVFEWELGLLDPAKTLEELIAAELDKELKPLVEKDRAIGNAVNCVSEQGRDGILWTVFDGAPFSSRRIASFANADDAREYLQLRAQLAEAQELLKAARAGQPLGPIIGAQTMLNQDSEIRHLKAQLASEQEKVRKAVEALIWIAQQGCDGDYTEYNCAEAPERMCVTEYCLPCYANEALKAQATLRELEGEPTAPAPKT